MHDVHRERQLLTGVGGNLAEEVDDDLLDVFSGLLGDPCDPELPSPLVGVQVNSGLETVSFFVTSSTCFPKNSREPVRLFKVSVLPLTLISRDRSRLRDSPPPPPRLPH